jgi:2-oxoglutarate decarboxylase
VRAKQDRLNLAARTSPSCRSCMHGDAAFAGQGVVAETLQPLQLRGYRTGGTVHVIINNQVGFTTAPSSSSRSSLYCTDVAKMIQAPIFHVNGDDPEACVRVAELAYEFRQAFHKDVVIDMVCYRRRGHNEGDDPSMTQPLMYNLIEAKRSVRKLYTEALIGRGDISRGGRSPRCATTSAARAGLRRDQGGAAQPGPASRPGVVRGTDVAATPVWSGRPLRPATRPAPSTPTQTAISRGDAAPHRRRLHRPPGRLHGAPKLQMLEKRAAMTREGGDRLGHRRAARLRLAAHRGHAGAAGRPGQPPRHLRPAPRGPHRPENGEEWTPLPTSATTRPSSGSTTRCCRSTPRWASSTATRSSGPTRSCSGRPSSATSPTAPRHHRRVHLQLGAEVGPAQLGRAAAAARLRGPGPGPLLGPHRALPAAVRRGQHDRRLPLDAGSHFHLLRRQAYARPRRPLIVFTPKSMLRLKAASSAPGGLHDRRFEPVLGDNATLDRQRGDRVLLASGKVVYDLEAEREQAQDDLDGDPASRAALPAARARPRRGPGAVPNAEFVSCRTSRRTRAPGRSWRSTCRRLLAAHGETRPPTGGLAARSRPLRRPARTSSTTGSGTPSCATLSTADRGASRTLIAAEQDTDRPRAGR